MKKQLILILFMFHTFSMLSQFEKIRMEDHHFPMFDEKPKNIEKVDYFIYLDDSLSIKEIGSMKQPDFSYYYTNNQLDSFYRKIETNFFWSIFDNGKKVLEKSIENNIIKSDCYFFYDSIGNETLSLDTSSELKTKINYVYKYENGFKVYEEINTVKSQNEKKLTTTAIIVYTYEKGKIVSRKKEDGYFSVLYLYDSLSRIFKMMNTRDYKSTDSELFEVEVQYDSLGNIRFMSSSSPYYYQTSSYKYDQDNNIVFINEEIPKKGYEMTDEEKREFSASINENIEAETIYMVPESKVFEFKYDFKGNWYYRKLKGSNYYTYRRIVYN